MGIALTDEDVALFAGNYLREHMACKSGVSIAGEHLLEYLYCF
jgi:hypothetical protein